MTFHIGDADVALELDYLDNVDDYFGAVDALRESIDKRADESSLEYMHRCANMICTFFDSTCGEGTAKAAFGDRIHIRKLFKSYHDFIDAVNTELNAIAVELAPPNTVEEEANDVQFAPVSANTIKRVKKAVILPAVIAGEAD